MSDHRSLFQNSLRRCLEAPHFLARFYEIFLDSSEEVREKFKNTDFEKQRRALRDSFFVLDVIAESTPDGPAWQVLRKIAIAHDREHMNVPPGLYDLWLECLLKAVAEHDPEYSPEVARAWRDMLKDGIEYMQSAWQAN